MVVMVPTLLLIAAGAIDIAVVLKLVLMFRHVRAEPYEQPIEADLPTVSICITARNETHAMTQCLERVVASEYPKLEVIVLDDGSRDDTSLLIKSFAHAGVRFVEGRPLPEGWLGKNYAQSLLAREASGQILFFMDVDTLIDRHTVARAVTVLLGRKGSMLSIVPMRSERWLASALFTTMRHFWALMRYTKKHPRATANAWLIERKLLVDEFTNNDALPLSMKVETTLAQKLAQSNKYGLVLSDHWLGVRYEKRWSSQVETSIRVLYPQCHKHWYEVLLLMALLAITLCPYALLPVTPWALLLVAFQYAVAYYYLSHVWDRFRFVGALLLPVTIAQEIVLLVFSAYRYEFGVITWKGRPITSSKAVR